MELREVSRLKEKIYRKSEEHKFWIERFLDWIPLPYPITSVLLGVFLYLIWLVVAMISGCEFMFIKDTWFILVCSFIAFLLGATKYAFDDVRCLPSRIREIFDMTDTDFQSFFINRLKSIFSPQHLVIGILFIITLLLYGHLSRSYWVQREYNFVMYVTGIVYFVVICLIIGMACWVAGWGIEFYRWLGREAPLRLRPLRADRVSGLRPITQQHLMSTFLIAIGMGFLILISEAAKFTILGLCIFLILFYFFVPQYYIHRRLVKVKRVMLEEIGDKLYERSVDFLTNLEETNNKQESRLDIGTLELLLTIINRMREWPFDFGIFLKAIGSAIVPISIFILELLLRG